MDPQDRQHATGPRLAGPLDALAQRGIAGAVSLFLQSADLNDIIRHVDLDAVLNQVNINQLLQRVDVNALLARVDVDALLARVDLDALLARVDVDALIDRMDLSAVIARSSAGAASETMHEVRDEARRLGDSADRLGHLFHHDHAPEAETPPASEDPGQA